MLWQYVNSMNCIVWVGVGRRGVEVWRCGLGLLLYKGCLVIVLLGIGTWFVGMCILEAIMGPFVVGLCY